MKAIFQIILIILVTSAAGDRHLTIREYGDLAPLYAHSAHHRDRKSAGDEPVTNTYIIKLKDDATRDEFLLLEGYLQNNSISLDDGSQWEGVTRGVALPLNPAALHWVSRDGTHAQIARIGYQCFRVFSYLCAGQTARGS